MTPEQFTYWLQGFMEISNPTTLDEIQTQIIKDHLALVFNKQTPDRTHTPPLAPMPTTPYPIWQQPHPIPYNPPFETDPNIFRPICETSTHIETDPMKVKYCNTSHIVPPHMFGKKEEDILGTDSLKVVDIRRNTYKKILDRK
jgi:hypothetical protein